MSSAWNGSGAHMATWKRTNPRISKPPTVVGLISLLGLFAGLCAAFALVVTAADAWREHVQAGWRAATATIERRSVDQYRTFKSSGGYITWHIRCRVRYFADAEEVETSIRSRSTNSQRDAGWMQQWVDRHEPGSTLIVHYDPDNHNSAVLTETDMPYAGPRTPDNVKLALISSTVCVMLLAVAKLLRRRSPEG
jgi:hypothetical protein